MPGSVKSIFESNHSSLRETESGALILIGRLCMYHEKLPSFSPILPARHSFRYIKLIALVAKNLAYVWFKE